MGLIEQAQNKQQPVPPVDSAQAAGDQSKTSYLNIGKAAMKIIYTKSTSDRLLQIMESGKDDPINAVAIAAMAVLGRIEAEIKGIDPKLAYSVAPQVVLFLLELAGVAKIFEADESMIKDVLMKLAEMTKAEQEQPGAQAGMQPMPQQMPQPMGA